NARSSPDENPPPSDARTPHHTNPPQNTGSPDPPPPPPPPPDPPTTRSGSHSQPPSPRHDPRAPTYRQPPPPNPPPTHPTRPARMRARRRLPAPVVRHPWLAVAVLLLLISVGFVVATGVRPAYDAYGWLVWGRQAAHLRLDTNAAPSWKPLTFLFTFPYALAL